MFTQDIVQQYNLKDIVSADGYVYMDIRKVMPGLKQAGILSIDRLTNNLARNGYALVPHTPFSGTTTRQTSCFPSSLMTLESSTHERKTPTTC